MAYCLGRIAPQKEKDFENAIKHYTWKLRFYDELINYFTKQIILRDSLYDQDPLEFIDYLKDLHDIGYKYEFVDKLKYVTHLDEALKLAEREKVEIQSMVEHFRKELKKAKDFHASPLEEKVRAGCQFADLYELNDHNKKKFDKNKPYVEVTCYDYVDGKKQKTIKKFFYLKD